LQLDDTRLRHAAIFISDFEGGLEAATRFLGNAIENGDDCAIVAPDSDREAWQAGLRRHGVQAPGNGYVLLISSHEWVPGRGLNSILMSRRLWERAEQAQAANRELSVVFDMAWAVELDAPADKVCHWEATCDHLVSTDSNIDVLCLYNTQTLATAMLHAALRTHPVIDVRGELVQNPYFEAPAILQHEPNRNQCSDDPQVVRPMLQHFIPAE
jgi:hypothetical protein